MVAWLVRAAAVGAVLYGLQAGLLALGMEEGWPVYFVAGFIAAVSGVTNWLHVK